MILVVGLNHATASVEVREALAFSREEIPTALAALREHGLTEAMLLSTCNRVEVYGRAAEPGIGPMVGRVLRELRPKAPAAVASQLYVLEGDSAVKHAFRVAASLDSMVLGEPQILGQVKEAYLLAEASGTLGSVLVGLRNRSVAAAKRVRTETSIGQNAVSISYVAVELARKIFGDLTDRKVLLVGAGKMSELAARHLVRSGVLATVLGGRHFEKAEELAQALGGRAAPFEDMREEMGRAEIVISSTGAPGTVIRREDVLAALSLRRNRPLFIIDIAVPRDVDREVRQLPGVFLYDLDDLKGVAEANLRERRKEAAAAEVMIEREVGDFLAWRRSLDVVPLVVELRRRGEEIRRAEMEKMRSRLGALTPEQEKAVDALTAAIVNKLLHAPTVQLKEAANAETHEEHLSLIRRVLGL